MNFKKRLSTTCKLFEIESFSYCEQAIDFLRETVGVQCLLLEMKQCLFNTEHHLFK